MIRPSPRKGSNDMSTVSTPRLTAEEFYEWCHRPENRDRHFELLRWCKVLRRVSEFLQRGVAVVWVIDPEGRTATIQLPQVLEEHDEVSCPQTRRAFAKKVFSAVRRAAACPLCSHKAGDGPPPTQAISVGEVCHGQVLVHLSRTHGAPRQAVS
jgi:hypothetical protein